MNVRLYLRNQRPHKDLCANVPSKIAFALISPKGYSTHLGTAHPVFLALSLCALATLRELFAALLVVSITAVAFAQEDVAETTAKFQIDTTPITEAPITDSDRAHWAFAPIQRRSVPATKQSAWLRSPIDAF